MLAVVDEELDRLANDGPDAGELDRVRARLSARLFREVDDVLGRTLTMAVFELLHGDPALLNALPGSARGGDRRPAVVGGRERKGAAAQPAGAATRFSQGCRRR